MSNVVKRRSIQRQMHAQKNHSLSRLMHMNAGQYWPIMAQHYDELRFKLITFKMTHFAIFNIFYSFKSI